VFSCNETIELIGTAELLPVIIKVDGFALYS